MKNQEIARIFYEIADILEIKKIQWKPRAYRKAAKSIESLAKDVEDIYKDGGIKELEKIQGIGERLAKKVIEYIETGKISEYERLKGTIPEGLDKLMNIMGIGPKKALKLYKKLNIKNVKELEEAIKKHKLRDLFGFGEKTEQNIEEGLKLYKTSKQRILLGLILPVANNIINQLKYLKEIQQISLAGSLRRMKETIGDIDILVASSDHKKVMDYFTALREVKRVLAKGLTKSMILLEDNIQADLRVLDEKVFGSALQYFTGNREHNIRLREIAIKKGYKLSEYGLFRKKDNKLIAGKTEREIYKKLGLQYIPPELRENRGEVELAKQNKIPKLIGYNDIKGDLHLHTKASDGSNTIRELVDAAKKLGYQYICITDHSKTRAIAHGLKEENLLQQIKEIKKLNNKNKGFYIFSGTEVDILSDGSLDFDDYILKKLDFVCASVHTGFKMSKSKMTNRIIKALENKYVRVLGHPTARLINQRLGYDIDFEQVLDIAKDKNKFLEINCIPARLDLNDSNIKLAVEKGVKLALGTDAHAIAHLDFMQLGVAQARRGFAEKEDIINTYNLDKMVKIINN
jgi:DNA polymerase (family 10)